MKLSHDQVHHIAELAKLELSDAEVALFSEQLSDMLDHFQMLNALDTDDIPPTAQAIRQRNVMRDDVVRPSLSPHQVLANAPKRQDDHFSVKPILD